MSSFFTNIENVSRKLDPVNRWVMNKVIGPPQPGTNYYGEATPVVTPTPPSQDAAYNSSQAAAAQAAKRRGVLQNIFAGSNPNVTSQTQTGKSALGN
jgi:hypothetical protein